MRHRRRHKSLHRSKGVHKAYLRSLAHSLLIHGRVETTLEKAKEARGEIDRLITLGKEGSLQARRKALKILGKEEPLQLLFKEVAPLFQKRHGGYTRVIRSWTRVGDGVQLAILELTEQKLPQEKKEKKKALVTKPTPKPSTPPETKGQKETPVSEKPKAEKPKEEKPTGFLGSLRRFLKPKDRPSS